MPRRGREPALAALGAKETVAYFASGGKSVLEMAPRRTASS